MAGHDPTDLNASERERDRAERERQKDQEVEDSDIRWLMADKRGRRIAHRILSRGGVFQPSFNTNALLMSFAEGKRNEATLMNARLLDLCPEHYLTMLKEHKTK